MKLVLRTRRPQRLTIDMAQSIPMWIDEKTWPIQSRSQMGFRKKERTHE